ncbi:MAG TPA: lipid-A-disaccharide synthase [Cytophagaceae bacterium]|jgi:lipid-A-disaccharide synthase
MKYYIIAGERSGDLHASNLIKSIKQLDKNSNVRGLGGDYLISEGMSLFKNYSEISFMGFLEVFKNLKTISKVLKSCKQDILDFQPDALILVDFAGFNLKIAEFAKKNNIKVFYYISPKIWAWNQKRAYKIKRLVDKMLVILPFEKEFYKKYDYEVDYVGNPLKDAISNFASDPTFAQKLPSSKPIIAILPGSRKQEVDNILMTCGGIVNNYPDHQFVIAGVSNLSKEFYERFTSQYQATLVIDQTYDLLKNAQAAIVTSGTATLETALFKVPQIVVYKTSPITYMIAKNLIKVPYISLVNLIAGKEVVKELIQNDFNSNQLKIELDKLLFDQKSLKTIKDDYDKLDLVLGEAGASMKAAKLISEGLTTS